MSGSVMRPLGQALALAWQVPLSLVSWAAHRALRAVFLRVASLAPDRPRQWTDIRWRGLSQVLANPFARWFVMLVGPRWNCHAVLADLGPLRVESEIALLPSPVPLRSDQHLSFVVYDKRYRIAGCLVMKASGDTAVDALPKTLQLPAGIYRVSARLYGYGPADHYPPVRIDGRHTLPAGPIASEAQHYETRLLGLKAHRSPALWLLHYHVFHVLRWRRVLGESLARRLFVPVGNPATAFHFGAIRRGQTLHLSVPALASPAQDPSAVATGWTRVFVAFYDRHSLPRSWAAMSEPHGQFEAGSSGYFLIRVLAHSEEALERATHTLRWHC